MFLQTATTQMSRPRLVGDDILIGKSTVLARRFASNGCWEVEKPQSIALSRLLSMAYGKRISINDGLLKQFDRAFGALPRNLREVEQILSTLPAPLAETEDRVAEASRLLKDGVSPYKLDTVLRGRKYGLRPAPDWAETLTLCDKGLVLGKGTVILPLTDDGLELEGREAQVLALLSVARCGLVPAETLAKLATVCRALARGETSVAAIALSHLRQPPLTDGVLAKSLNLAAVRMRRGMTPLEVLRKAGFGKAALEKTYGLTEVWRKFNPNHKPAGSPEGGQFSSADAGSNAGGDSRDKHENSQVRQDVLTPKHADVQISQQQAGQVDDRQTANDRKFPYDRLYLRDGTPVNSPFTLPKTPIEIPKDVSLIANVQIGEKLRDLPPEVRMYRLYQMFSRGGTMDYQSRDSIDDQYNTHFISIGNFNFGAVMAAAGYSLEEAKNYAAIINATGGGEKRYRLFGGNPKNEEMIETGYDAYQNHKLPVRQGDAPQTYGRPSTPVGDRQMPDTDFLDAE